MTSYLFSEAKFSLQHLKAILNALGLDKQKLVIDLSCRKQGTKWIVAMNKWQTMTNFEVNKGQDISSPWDIVTHANRHHHHA